MALTGYTRACGMQSGGGKKLYLAEAPNVTSFTKTQEAYSAVTMESGKLFKVYDFDPDSMEIVEEVAVENNSMKVVHRIVWDMMKLSATARTAVEEIALASACGLIAIAEDNNAVLWVIGYSENHLKTRPLELKSAKGTTGKKLTDTNKWELTLESEDNSNMRVFSGTVPIS